MGAVTALAVRLMGVMKVLIAACMTAPAVPATATMIVLRRAMNVRNPIARRIGRAMCATVLVAQPVMMGFSA